MCWSFAHSSTSTSILSSIRCSPVLHPPCRPRRPRLTPHPLPRAPSFPSLLAFNDSITPRRTASLAHQLGDEQTRCPKSTAATSRSRMEVAVVDQRRHEATTRFPSCHAAMYGPSSRPLLRARRSLSHPTRSHVEADSHPSRFGRGSRCGPSLQAANFANPHRRRWWKTARLSPCRNLSRTSWSRWSKCFEVTKS